jgi:hypothetical protein
MLPSQGSMSEFGVLIECSGTPPNFSPCPAFHLYLLHNRMSCLLPNPPLPGRAGTARGPLCWNDCFVGDVEYLLFRKLYLKSGHAMLEWLLREWCGISSLSETIPKKRARYVGMAASRVIWNVQWNVWTKAQRSLASVKTNTKLCTQLLTADEAIYPVWDMAPACRRFAQA